MTIRSFEDLLSYILNSNNNAIVELPKRCAWHNFFNHQHYPLLPLSCLLDALVEAVVGFGRVFQASGNDVGAKEDTVAAEVIDAIAFR